MKINKLTENIAIISLVLLASGTVLATPQKKAIENNNQAAKAETHVADEFDELDEQESSDQKAFRFAVSMKDNRVVKIVYYRVADKKIYSQAFPHGRSFAKNHDPEKIYTRAQFKRLMAKLQKKSPVSLPSSSAALVTTTTASTDCTSNGTCTTGMGLGYNPSVGYLGGGSQCYNFTTALSATSGNLNFSSANTASSQAGQTSVSADVQGSYDAFYASDSFSYSSSYNNSQNSGSVFFSASQLATAAFTLNADPSTGLITPASALNATGNQQLQANTFSAQCGSDVLSSAPVGMLITGEFGWASSSASSSEAISNSTKVSAGLDSISVAVSNATQNSTTSNSFSFTTNVEGGGTAANASWSLCTSATQISNDQTSCMAGNVASCDSFTTEMNSCAVGALDSYNTSLAQVIAGNSHDMTIATVFPYGVKGVTMTPTQGKINSIATLFANSLSSVDPFTPLMSSALSNYATILNQVATLYNRAGYLNSAIKGKAFDPMNLNLTSATSSLMGVFSLDKSTFITTLNNCLTQGSASSDCTTISNMYADGVHNAWDWYGSTTYNPIHNSVTTQQNTIALQYTGLVNYTGSSTMSFPVDVIWTQALPNPFTLQATPANGASGGSTPNGLPALIAFADAPYPFNGALTTNHAWATMYPMNTGYTLTDPSWKNDSETVANTAWYSDSGFANFPTVAGADTCATLSFTDTSCYLTSNLNSLGHLSFYLGVQLNAIQGLLSSQVTTLLQ